MTGLSFFFVSTRMSYHGFHFTLLCSYTATFFFSSIIIDKWEKKRHTINKRNVDCAFEIRKDSDGNLHIQVWIFFRVQQPLFLVLNLLISISKLILQMFILLILIFCSRFIFIQLITQVLSGFDFQRSEVFSESCANYFSSYAGIFDTTLFFEEIFQCV